jgi:predicted O-methyltransferase YrrM
MFGKEQIYVIAKNDPLVLLNALVLLKNPFDLKDLINGNSENLPTDFYIVARKLLLKYSEIKYRKYSNYSKLNQGVLDELINEYHGDNYIQRFLVKWNTTLYILIRMFKPKIIVETGVLWGYSSSNILKAISENCEGNLYSIDLTDQRLIDRGFNSGPVVPDNLKNKWELINGRSDKKLPYLLDKLKKIDIFIHDSEHSYENMLFEYETAYEYLNEDGLIISHDVNDNTAFPDFCKNKGLYYVMNDNIGVALKNNFNNK